jgi:hypothetical protein
MEDMFLLKRTALHAQRLICGNTTYVSTFSRLPSSFSSILCIITHSTNSNSRLDEGNTLFHSIQCKFNGLRSIRNIYNNKDVFMVYL